MTQPADRDQEMARVIVGRCVTAFGNKIRGGDAQARESAEWGRRGFSVGVSGVHTSSGLRSGRTTARRPVGRHTRHVPAWPARPAGRRCDRICGKYARYHKDRCPLYKANCAAMAEWNRRNR